MVCAQTAERVCLYIKRFDEEKAQTDFTDQQRFRGRLKMYDADPEEGHTPRDEQIAS
jgi:hypothetical protein